MSNDRRLLLLASSLVLTSPALAATATFTPIDNAYSLGVSQNGQYVVGPNAPNDPNNAFRWDAVSESNQLLGYLPGGFSHSAAFGVSGDGTVVVGIASGASYLDQLPARYTEATGWVTLGNVPGSLFRGRALGISDDGSVIAGWVRMADGNTQQAFRWTEKSGMVGLGLGFNGSSRAVAISADGSTIVGDSGVHAMRWTEAGGMVNLGTLGGSYSQAHAVSADGSVIVGYATESHVDPIHNFPFKWENGFMVKLGTEPGSARGVSGDGQTIVGATGSEAFIWDATNGVRNLRNVLVNEHGLGAALSGWTLHDATAISTDGSTIVGWGTNPQGGVQAWVVDFESPTTCTGDVVSSKTFQPPPDGLVDGADLAYLLGEWGARPGSSADLVDSATFEPPPDGVVDGADLAYLLGAWGTCR